jgi:large subunit ribosomal protein L29
MKNTDLTALSVTDLQERIRDEKASLHKMRFNHTVSPVENPTRIRQSRREVARMMTELNARQRSNNNA